MGQGERESKDLERDCAEYRAPPQGLYPKALRS